jgi:hypothetical protein
MVCLGRFDAASRRKGRTDAIDVHGRHQAVDAESAAGRDQDIRV